MIDERLAAFIDRHAALWNTGDAAALSLDHTEDGLIVSPMFRRLEGRAQIHRSYEQLFESFPDWQLRYEAPIMDGQRVAVPFAVTATLEGEFMGVAASGRHCAFDGVSLFELSDHLLIKEERRFYDFTGLLTQLGVLRVRVT